MKTLFKKAHELTKEIKTEYPEVDYKAQFSICLSYLQKMKGDNEMVELQGSEKQIKWAEDIKKELIETVVNYKENFNTATWEKSNYLKTWKEEILERKEEEKITIGKAKEILNTILDYAMEEIKKETSAKKLIDIKTSLKLHDANIKDYIIKKFI